MLASVGKHRLVALYVLVLWIFGCFRSRAFELFTVGICAIFSSLLSARVIPHRMSVSDA